ncbi:Uncharacterised protein [Mycobacteroides abscessus subsp. abscessus]|nr:Uncharacterised protein [Mycobacteroides abscessus subsp. abscessus]
MLTGGRPAIGGGLLKPVGGVDLPAMLAQPLDGVLALIVVDEGADADVLDEFRLEFVHGVLPLTSGRLPPAPFGGKEAAGCGVRGDVLEQRVLGGPGQICQQTLGEPGSGFSGVEARRPQGRDPVIPKVHGDLAPLGQRYRVLFAQHVILEFEDFRLIELVHDGAVGPGQPVDPGIQAGGQDHYLLDAGTCCSREEFVEILGTHGEMVDQVDGGGVPLGLGRARGQRLGETRFAGGLNEGTGVLVAD